MLLKFSLMPWLLLMHIYSALMGKSCGITTFNETSQTLAAHCKHIGQNNSYQNIDIFSSPEPLGSQGELIVYPSSRRPSVRPSAFTMLTDLLRNCWADQSQILCGASLGRGNNILFAASGSHDQDGRHAHIW